MKIGAQLYTVRKFTQTPEDFAETLARVADIGYKTIQVSATCAYEGEWLRTELEKNGLECAVTHNSDEALRTQAAALALKHRIFGCRYVGLGSYHNIAAGYDGFSAAYKPVTAVLRENGCLFMYHNHGAEFERMSDGRTVLEHMVSDFTADELGVILDLYWVQYGGANPCDVITALRGRIPCVHFKDLGIVGGAQRMMPIGSGNINFERAAAACEESGCEYALVEQDDCYGEDPFECLKKSYKYLKSIGLE